ncbi:CBU_0592 family membrane protein [Aestuariibius sp. 2305UL40-4]|uniref:CBU_0592 family membrane protein n=1 Tax=Aestuariibius violaceus TaxID=3234132 RepID=UPI00345E2224
MNFDLGFVDLIGSFGTVMVVTAYFLTQARLLDAARWEFPTINLVGSLLISLSLYYNFNLASVVMEFFWIVISIFGIWQSLRSHRGGMDDGGSAR